MALIKCVMFFKQKDQGWSETFYREGATALSAMPALTELRFQRMKVFPQGGDYMCYAIRSSVDGAPRDAAWASFGPGVAQGQDKGTPGRQPEQAYDAINLRLFSGSETWRSFLMRGIPSNWVNSDSTITATAYEKLVPFLEALTTTGWALKKRTVTNLAQVVGITPGADQRRVTITVANPVPGLLVNGRLALSLCEGISPVNHVWRVRSLFDGSVLVPPANSTYTTFPGLRRVYGTYAANSGYVGLVTYEPALIDRANVVRGTRRDTGRPSYVPRGRRSVVR